MLSLSMITSTEVVPSAVVKYICRSPCRRLNLGSPRNPRSSKKAITSRFFDETHAKSMSWSFRARCGNSGQSTRTACPPRSLSGMPLALAARTTSIDTSNASGATASIAQAYPRPPRGVRERPPPRLRHTSRSGRGRGAVTSERYDFVIVGRRLRRLRARQPPVGRSRRTGCSCSRPAGPTTRGTSSSTCRRR